jgi:membrane protein YqaA with SNARE-associated domain
VLAAIAFADSSFLPIPPDLLLVPMALVRPKQIWALSLICTVASSLGAVVGYLIGYGLWSLVGVPLVELYGYGNGFTAYQHLIEKWGVWIIIAKSLTPVPFKIMAIAAGVAAMSPTADRRSRRRSPPNGRRDLACGRARWSPPGESRRGPSSIVAWSGIRRATWSAMARSIGPAGRAGSSIGGTAAGTSTSINPGSIAVSPWVHGNSGLT